MRRLLSCWIYISRGVIFHVSGFPRGLNGAPFPTCRERQKARVTHYDSYGRFQRVFITGEGVEFRFISSITPQPNDSKIHICHIYVHSS